MGQVTPQQGAPPVDADMASAWARTRADRTIQFDLPAFKPPEMPPWLRWLLEHLDGIGAVGKILFWIALFAAGIALVALIVRLVRRFKYRKSTLPDAGTFWQPEASAARALLAEADAMADAGRYDAAARLLLHRSLEDVARHRPALVRPAATTREIGGADAFPIAARGAFTPIAAAVEWSLFGGRALAREDWDAARTAYRDFALPGAWA